MCHHNSKFNSADNIIRRAHEENAGECDTIGAK
jgi:hypothetical protein